MCEPIAGPDWLTWVVRETCEGLMAVCLLPEALEPLRSDDLWQSSNFRTSLGSVLSHVLETTISDEEERNSVRDEIWDTLFPSYDEAMEYEYKAPCPGYFLEQVLESAIDPGEAEFPRDLPNEGILFGGIAFFALRIDSEDRSMNDDALPEMDELGDTSQRVAWLGWHRGVHEMSFGLAGKEEDKEDDEDVL